MSRVVSIYLQSVTFGMIPVRSLMQLTQLESSSDQAERSLISHLRAQVAKGVIRLQESTRQNIVWLNDSLVILMFFNRHL